MTAQLHSSILPPDSASPESPADNPGALRSHQARGYIQSARCPATRRARLADLLDAARRLELGEHRTFFELSSEQLASYRDLLTELRQAPATVARKMSSLRGLYTYAMRRGWAGHNPADSALVPLPRVSKQSLSEWLSKEEAKGILSTCDRTTTKGLRDYAMLLVLIYHGLRREELVSLTPAKPADWGTRRTGGYFSTERHHIVLTIKGKGSRIRRHPVKPATLEAVEDYLLATGRSLRSNEPLFRPLVNHRTGVLEKAISAEGLAVVVHTRAAAAGILRRITAHSFRHSSATFALDGGSTVRKVADFLGHVDVRTTMLYDRARENLDDNAALSITL
jgi:site-specific recombinase XerD